MRSKVEVEIFIEQHRKTWYFNAEMKGASAVVFRPEC